MLPPASASVEVAGVLPGPALKSNRGAADLLSGQLFAYGVGPSVAVVEVHSLQLACLLQGGHRNHSVTAVKWCPDCHSRDLKSHSSHLRLASGDADGGVVVWSVLSGTLISRLEDHFGTKEYARAVSGSRAGGGGGGGGADGGGGGGGAGAAAAGSTPGGVAGLAWVLSSPAVLAVLLSPATLLLWDARGGAVLWKREMSAVDIWQGLEVDPLDCRRLAVTSAQGGLALVTFEDLAGEHVDIKQYRVYTGSQSSGPGGKDAAGAVAPAATFSARFCATRDLLLLLLPREIIVYDTELGTPAASRALPPGRPPFASLLTCWGSGVSGGAGDEGGCDCLYTVHTDGSLSVFVRVPGELRFQAAGGGRLTPPHARATQVPLVLLAACAGLWRHGSGGGGEEAPRPRAPGARVEAATQRLRASLLADHIGGDHGRDGSAGGTGVDGSPATAGGAFAAAAASGNRSAAAARAAAATSPPARNHHPAPPGSLPAGAAATAAGGGGGAANAAAAGGAAGEAAPALLIVSLTADGRVWRWESPLPLLPRPPAPGAGGGDSGGSGGAAAGGGGSGGTPVVADWPIAQPPPQSLLKEGTLHAPPPQLSGQLCMLPSAVTALAVYPRPVAAASPLGHAASGRGGGGGCVLLGAAVTIGGSIEVFTMQRGLVSPLSLHVSASLHAHRTAARGVRWLGASPRLATFSSDRGPHGWRNVLLVTDVRSGRTAPLRDRSGEGAPLLGLRASPCGSYLLVLFKGAAAELWGVWPGVAPARLRLVDLPFSCVEWVQSYGPANGHNVQPEDVTAWDLAREPPAPPPALSTSSGAAAGVAAGGSGRSLGARGSNDGSVQWLDAPTPPMMPSPPPRGAAAAAARLAPHASSALFSSDFESLAAAAAAATGGAATVSSIPAAMPAGAAAAAAGAAAPPEAFLAFTLVDGRAGLLSVRGRRVTDTRVKRPMAGLLAPLEMAASAMAVWGRTAVMGDGEGRLAVWEMGTGRTTVLPTGLGLVRKIQINVSPPAAVTAGIGRASATSMPALSSADPGGRTPTAATLGATPFTASAAGAAGVASPTPAAGPYAGPTGAAAAAAATASAAAAASTAGGAATGGPGGAAAAAAATCIARVAVLYSTGQCCVFDMDASCKLRPTAATAAAVQRAGVRAVLDVAWLPLWWADQWGTASDGGGGGSSSGLSLLAAVTDEGALSVLDVAAPPLTLPTSPPAAAGTAAGTAAQGGALQPGRGVSVAGAVGAGGVSPMSVRRRPFGAASSRAMALKAALQPPPPLRQPRAAASDADEAAAVLGAIGGAPLEQPLCLEAAPCVGSCLLLARPWAMLLRLLLQLGVSQEALRYLCGPHSAGEAEEEDVRHELLARVPRGARAALLALLTEGEAASGSADEALPDGGSSSTAAAAAAVARSLAVLGGGGAGGAQLPLPAAGPAIDAAAPGAAPAVPVLSPSGGSVGTGGGSGNSAFTLPGSMLRAVSYAFNTLGIGGPEDGPPAPHAASGAPAAPAEGASQLSAPRGSGGAGGVAGGVAGVGAGGGGGGGAAALPVRGGLLQLLRTLASMRAQGRLLHPAEWLAYGRALMPGASPADRMALGAQVAGDVAEERFWTHLPATLAAVRGIRDTVMRHRVRDAAASMAQHTAAAAAVAAAATAASGGAGAGSGSGAAAAGRQGPLVPLHEPPPALRAPAAGTVAARGPAGPLAAPASLTSGAGAGGAAAATDAPMSPSVSARRLAVALGAGARTCLLWDEHMAMAEAQERIRWHEALGRGMFDTSPALQERRLLEYVCVGDLQTAVAFLLAASPDNSARYYRDALCTVALAAAAAAAAAGTRDAAAAAAAGQRAATAGGAAASGAPLSLMPPPPPPPASRGPGAMLLVQAAKVVSAHAASVGDVLLGVPLHVAAGLHSEAALVLQECGMWRHAAALTAHALHGGERAAALSRWAEHVWRSEGSPWRAAGLLTSGGCLGAALRLLLDAGLPDCAAAYAAACRHAGLLVPLNPGPLGGGAGGSGGVGVGAFGAGAWGALGDGSDADVEAMLARRGDRSSAGGAASGGALPSPLASPNASGGAAHAVAAAAVPAATAAVQQRASGEAAVGTSAAAGLPPPSPLPSMGEAEFDEIFGGLLKHGSGEYGNHQHHHHHQHHGAAGSGASAPPPHHHHHPAQHHVPPPRPQLVELFDALDQSACAVVPGACVGRGPQDLQRAAAEFERFVSDLLGQLL